MSKSWLLVAACVGVMASNGDAQIVAGASAGVALAPHMRGPVCGGERLRQVSAVTELRVGARVGGIEVTAGAARHFNLSGVTTGDCFYPDQGQYTVHEYDHERSPYSMDVTGWYPARARLKLGVEAGYFWGIGQYAGLGVGSRLGPLDVEILGRLHHVSYRILRYETRPGMVTFVGEDDDVSKLLPGFSLRLVYVK